MRTTFQSRDRTSTELSMTPMIDVVFMLLIFFIATASFEKIEKILPGGVSQEASPKGTSQQAIAPEALRDINDCVARLIADPTKPNGLRYQFNGVDLETRDVLLQQMTAVIRAKSDIPIIVHPDESVSLGQAIDVYDHARNAGGLQVFFAAD